MIIVEVSWDGWKAFLAARPTAAPQIVLDKGIYKAFALDGVFGVRSDVEKLDEPSAEQIDLEATYLLRANATPRSEVVNQTEKNDKTLKCAIAYGITDADGIAEARYPVPAGGRFLAYGDAEFEERHFFDRIIGIWLRDDDRLIALQIAQTLNPEATEPLTDADTAVMAGLPRYPILGHFEDEELVEGPPLFEGGPPSWCGGMTMSYRFSNTEVSAVGGYAFISGMFYFVIRAKKGERATGSARVGVGLQVSVDGAKLDA